MDIIVNFGLFEKLNESLYNGDFLDVINHFQKIMGLDSLRADFADEDPYFAEILTQSGLCETFNIADKNQVFDLNLTSNDFHYEFVLLRNLMMKEEENFAISAKRISQRFSGQLSYYMIDERCHRCFSEVKFESQKYFLMFWFSELDWSFSPFPRSF